MMMADGQIWLVGYRGVDRRQKWCAQKGLVSSRVVSNTGTI